MVQFSEEFLKQEFQIWRDFKTILFFDFLRGGTWIQFEKPGNLCTVPRQNCWSIDSFQMMG